VGGYGGLGVPHKLIRLCRAYLEVTTTEALKQGDALSPVLFKFALEKAIRTASVKAEIFGPGGPKLILAYTDDIGAVGESIP